MKELRKSLEAAISVASDRINPALGLVRMKSNQGMVSFMGTDVTHSVFGISHWNAPDFDILVDGKRMLQLFNQVEDVTINYDEDELRLILQTPNGEYKLATVEIKDWFNVEFAGDYTPVGVIPSVYWAASNDQMNAILSGVLLRSNDKIGKVVATDMYKIVEQKFPCPLDIDCIISRRTAQLIEGKVVAICDFGNALGFRYELDGVTVIVKALKTAGKYPQYEKVMPKKEDMDFFIEADIDLFREAIKPLAKYAEIFTFKTEQRKLTVTAESDKNSATIEIPCNASGAMEFKFNKTLTSILPKVDEFILIGTAPNKPFYLNNILIMPSL